MAVVTSLAMTVVPNTIHTKIILMVGKCVFCSGPLLVGFTHILHDYVNATGTIAWLPRWQLSNMINMMIFVCSPVSVHDDVIKWKHFPRYRPVTRSFDVFFDLRLNKRLSEQSWGWWFETLSCPLWRHCNGSSHAIFIRVVSRER